MIKQYTVITRDNERISVYVSDFHDEIIAFNESKQLNVAVRFVDDIITVIHTFNPLMVVSVTKDFILNVFDELTRRSKEGELVDEQYMLLQECYRKNSKRRKYDKV